jgi:hypothetical protein
MGGETGRKFIYQTRPGVLPRLCFHQASQNTLPAPSGHMLPAPSGSGSALIDKYLVGLGYNRDIIEWATTADPKHVRCLTPELAKELDIDAWYNTEDGQPKCEGRKSGQLLKQDHDSLSVECNNHMAIARVWGARIGCRQRGTLYLGA